MSRALLRDRTGAALVEFAIVAPVLLMLIFGSLEFGLNVYMRSVLEGAMQQAGRNSSLQSAQAGQTAIDDAVAAQVRNILPRADVKFKRLNYQTLTGVSRPEDFTDTNGNNIRDPGECFTDINNNSMWDADAGRTGQGGANDVVKYTATVTYPSWIPVAAAMGISPTTSISATTILKNQPFATQNGWTGTRICT